MDRIAKTIIPFISTFAVGVIGMLFVDSGVGSWYDSLHMPAFTPPNALFPIVWTALYVIMATACAIVWRKDPQNDHTEGWVRFFFVQLFISMGWTIFFFGYHSITIAFFVVLLLCIIIAGLAVSGWEIDHRVTFLMFPYLMWVLFAAYLTGGVWYLN